MTQEERLEYNKRCAEFLYPNAKAEYESGGDIDVTDGIYTKAMLIFGDFELMEFHSDWNWIMEVIEAIEKIFHIQGVEIEGRWCCIKTNIFHECRGLTKKEAVVEAINKFLIWHNANRT